MVAVSAEGMAADIGAILAKKGIVDIHIVCSMYEAVDLMLEQVFDYFVVDGELCLSSAADNVRLAGVDFVRFIRMCAGPVSEAHILFLRSDTKSQNLLEANAEVMEARDGGASCIIGRPFTAGKYNEIVEPVLRGNRAFIREKSYVGPCRRHNDRTVAVERRAHPTPKRRLRTADS